MRSRRSVPVLSRREMIQGGLGAVVAARLGLACNDPGAALVVPPDPARPLDLGVDGPYGVRLIERAFRVRADETVHATLALPVTPEGTTRVACPVLVVVQGGLVRKDRYAWLTMHAATRGILVVVPSFAFDLAFFQEGNGPDVLAAVRATSRRGDPDLQGALRDGPVAVVGHSLGGVVAAEMWARRAWETSHLALFASYPNGDDFSGRPPLPSRVLSLVGDRDGRAPLDRVRQGVRAAATAPATQVTAALVAGMTHMQFADAVSAAEAQADGVPAVTTEVARGRVLHLFDAFLADHETPGSGPALDDPTSWPEGLIAEGAAS